LLDQVEETLRVTARFVEELTGRPLEDS